MKHSEITFEQISLRGCIGLGYSQSSPLVSSVVSVDSSAFHLGTLLNNQQGRVTALDISGADRLTDEGLGRTTLVSSGEDAKIHSKRVEKILYTQ